MAGLASARISGSRTLQLLTSEGDSGSELVDDFSPNRSRLSNSRS
jgi:hypothetical protein